MTMMFRSMTLLVFSLIVSNRVLGAGQPASLSIGVTNSVVTSGDNITLEIVLKNTGDTPFSFGKDLRLDTGERLFQIETLDPNGRAAKLTHYGTIFYDNPPGYETPPQTTDESDDLSYRISGHENITLNPGDEFRETAALSKTFNMKDPGKYTILVNKTLPIGPRKLVTISSNTIAIEVTK